MTTGEEAYLAPVIAAALALAGLVFRASWTSRGELGAISAL